MATLTLTPSPYQSVFDTAGNPVVGALINTYLAGTTTPVATYTDSAGTVPNANPIVADSAGRYVAYLTPGVSYKFVITTSALVAIRTVDNILAVPGSASNLDITGTVGETVTDNQLVYLSDGSSGKTAGQWFKADSTNTYSSQTPELGIAPAGITSGNSGTIRLSGQLTNLSSLTVGALYYASTAGAITTTPSTIKRFVGQADTATSLVFSPDPPPPLTGIMQDFRLTLTSATPVTTADVTAATTLYLSPLTGNRCTVLDANGLATTLSSAEISIAVPNTSSQVYDVWVFSNSGVLALELLAWTNDTTRATAISRTTGVLTKTGDPTRRYVGSFRTTTVAGQTEDSVAKRYVWNYSNRVPRVMRVKEATDTWTYNGVFRQANGAAANQLDFVLGVAEVPVEAQVVATVSGNATGFPMWVSIGEDSTTTADANTLASASYTLNAGIGTTLQAQLKKYPAVGRHTWVWLEKASAATVTWYGDNASDGTQSGIHGTILG